MSCPGCLESQCDGDGDSNGNGDSSGYDNAAANCDGNENDDGNENGMIDLLSDVVPNCLEVVSFVRKSTLYRICPHPLMSISSCPGLRRR